MLKVCVGTICLSVAAGFMCAVGEKFVCRELITVNYPLLFYHRRSTAEETRTTSGTKAERAGETNDARPSADGFEPMLSLCLYNYLYCVCISVECRAYRGRVTKILDTREQLRFVHTDLLNTVMSLHRTVLSSIPLLPKPGVAAAFLLSASLLLCSHALSAQSTLYPIIAEAGKTMEAFIPQGWHFYDSTSGDLNKDQLSDVAFVIEQDAVEELDREEESEEVYEEGIGPARMLVVLFRQKEGGYRRSVQSNTCVLRDGEGGMLGDPWAGMAVDRGSLVLHFYGGSAWRWGLDYRFRFQDDDWFLIGATNIGYHSSSGEMESCDYNLLTGDVEITNGNVFGEECRACDDCGTCEPCERCGDCETCVLVEDQITWKKIDKQQLRRMAEFVPWEWEIMPDHYI